MVSSMTSVFYGVKEEETSSRNLEKSVKILLCIFELHDKSIIMQLKDHVPWEHVLVLNWPWSNVVMDPWKPSWSLVSSMTSVFYCAKRRTGTNSREKSVKIVYALLSCMIKAFMGSSNVKFVIDSTLRVSSMTNRHTSLDLSVNILYIRGLFQCEVRQRLDASRRVHDEFSPNSTRPWIYFISVIKSIRHSASPRAYCF